MFFKEYYIKEKFDNMQKLKYIEHSLHIKEFKCDVLVFSLPVQK